jgi:hypothetical protein
MDKSEFKQLCKDALVAVIELAEKYSHLTLPRQCYLRWKPRGELIQDNVIEELVAKLYTSQEMIRPCVDIGVAELTEDGIPVVIALVSGHAPCSSVDRSWSGRPGPFNYYVVGQLDSVPLPEGVFAYTIIPED